MIIKKDNTEATDREGWNQLNNKPAVIRARDMVELHEIEKKAAGRINSSRPPRTIWQEYTGGDDCKPARV